MIREIYNLYKYEFSDQFTEELLGPIAFQVKFFGLDLL